MANRLIVYRVAVEGDRWGRRRGGPRGKLSANQVANLLLRELARAARADAGAGAADRDDYDLASAAGISARQTGELYEESGVGPFVRDVLIVLEREGLVRIARKSATGRYRGIHATERGLRSERVLPWYQRILRFFEPPRRGEEPTADR